MKVYVIKNEYCDYEEYTNGELLLGISSTYELAIQARDAFVSKDAALASGVDNPAQISITEEGDPEVISFARQGGRPIMSWVYTITEWDVD